jgi:hypothetical protein
MSSAACHAAAAVAAAAKTSGNGRRAAAVRPAPRRAAAVATRAAAADAADAAPVTVNYKDVVFELPDAPVKTLIPEGPWKIIEGGVCAPKVWLYSC